MQQGFSWFCSVRMPFSPSARKSCERLRSAVQVNTIMGVFRLVELRCSNLAPPLAALFAPLDGPPSRRAPHASRCPNRRRSRPRSYFASQIAEEVDLSRCSRRRISTSTRKCMARKKSSVVALLLRPSAASDVQLSQLSTSSRPARYKRTQPAS